MRFCRKCSQPVAEEIAVCPSCGAEATEKMASIGGYRIERIVHEGHATILCRAVKDDERKPVMVRIFKPQSGVDGRIAERLEMELEELKKLPDDDFIRHLEIRLSSEGLWHRVSEWVESEPWGPLLASDRLQSPRTFLDLFRKITDILDGLHGTGHIIPHLILDDVIVLRDGGGPLDVKIDYKLSRFFDPKMDKPGPMLKKLIDCHPDIIHQRPLDYRSDIWSLGKIFVEILTGDPESTDFQGKIDGLILPAEFKALLKLMLADDPDLRPRSMAEVAACLARVTHAEIEDARQRHRNRRFETIREMRLMKIRMKLMTAGMVLLAAVGVFIWLYMAPNQGTGKEILENYANRYAGSAAFLMVEYRLLEGETLLYRNRTEGTAFLVDKEGWLLTNRHVACPWLEDQQLHALIGALRQLERSPRLTHSLYLWFEGEKAFKKLPSQEDMSETEDVYFVENAYRTGGERRLEIVGVGRLPVKTRQLIKSPLRDDFAVLKIDPAPEGLTPLPIDSDLDPISIRKLSPVITLGFPLGSQTQGTTVNVSVTRGHVRRSFENLLQVDTSIHQGNSGGPLIDVRGKVIGIASRVAMGWASGPVPMATHLPDIGMVLPITNAARFLRELKAGRTKWNGILDLSVDAKIKKIVRLAGKSKWREAAAMADRELEKSADPRLIMIGAMMHFCRENHPRAEELFSRSLSMDPENDHARWMLFVIDWLRDRAAVSIHGSRLLEMDWRAPAEFLGHLTRILVGSVDEKTALEGGYTSKEMGWIRYALALVRAKQGDPGGAEAHLKEAAIIAEWDDWVFYLSLAGLEKNWRRLSRKAHDGAPPLSGHDAREAFLESLGEARAARKVRHVKLAPLYALQEQDSASPADKSEALEKILAEEEVHGEALAGLAFYAAMAGEWEKALEHIHRFSMIRGRENDSRLSMELLEAQILFASDREADATTRLKRIIQRVEDPWYKEIARCLNGEIAEKTLIEKAGACPEYLVTAHMALGFRAEGSGQRESALKHYKEALGSYMDDWFEYEFAMERIRRLKNRGKGR